MSEPKRTLSYKDAGVDIDAGDAFVDRIKHVARRTSRPEVLGGLGGFGALCRIPQGYRRPLLVSGTDGVGTKLRLAMDLGAHDHIGIDLVAMCVNDLVVCGAEPLFFLDYYATGRLDVDTAARVVAGIGLGCEQAGCALVGGETAEMPGMYHGEDYDLAGFCVGVVEEDDLIDGRKVQAGDRLIALASSGVHSNGYSLVRKILDVDASDLQQDVGGRPLAEALMQPTRIYVRNLLKLLRDTEVHAIAHITGGGLPGNLPRVMAAHTQARIRRDSWQWPAIFTWLQERGGVAEDEMYRTFNCGVGMVLVVPAAACAAALERLQALGETAWLLGEIEASTEAEPKVVLA